LALGEVKSDSYFCNSLIKVVDACEYHSFAVVIPPVVFIGSGDAFFDRNKSFLPLFEIGMEKTLIIQYGCMSIVGC
jgi:hypothetical protein